MTDALGKKHVCPSSCGDTAHGADRLIIPILRQDIIILRQALRCVRVLRQIVQKLRAIRAAQRLVRPEKAVGRRHIILMNVILRLRFRFRLRRGHRLYHRLLHAQSLRLRCALAAA